MVAIVHLLERCHVTPARGLRQFKILGLGQIKGFGVIGKPNDIGINPLLAMKDRKI
jgi:hypothetical protein